MDTPALSALNQRLRDDYVSDCAKGITLWNNTIRKAGIDFEITLPHVGFHRGIGEFSDANVDPLGNVISDAEWAAHQESWLPTTADGDFIASLMEPCWEPGKYAGWISPPKVGIDNKPGDFEYVKIEG